MSNEDKVKNTGRKIVETKIFNLSRYQTNILLRGLKFTPTPKRNNIERADYDLLSFSKTKKQTILTKIFFKNNLPLPHLETRIEI